VIDVIDASRLRGHQAEELHAQSSFDRRHGDEIFDICGCCCARRRTTACCAAEVKKIRDEVVERLLALARTRLNVLSD